MLLISLLLTLPLQTQTIDDAALARGLELPELSLGSMAAWREHIRPAAGESSYEEIPWLSEFADGLQAASDEGKPLLFWAMNGHPLGTT